MSTRTARRTNHAPSGADEARLHMAAASACFTVGERANAYDIRGGFADTATVVYGYDLFEIEFGDGPGSENYYCRYQYGYVVRLDSSGELRFVPAHALTRSDYKPSYLRLVTNQGRPIGGGSPPERGRRC